MITDIDKARELSDAREIDTLCDAPDLPFMLVDRPEPYTQATWHMDCADLFTSADPEKNNYIRQNLAALMYHMSELGSCLSERSKLLKSQCIAMHLTNIGGQILENCIENNLTTEKAGNQYE